MTPNDKLKAAIDRLDESARRIVTERGYTRDAKLTRALVEMIREQIAHAHTGTATRTIR